MKPRVPKKPDMRVIDYVGAKDYFVSKHGIPVGNVETQAELMAALNGHLLMLSGNSQAARDSVRYLLSNGMQHSEINKTRS